MANSHYSKPMHLSCKSFCVILLLVFLLFVGSCTATRTGATMRLKLINESTEHLRRKHQPGFPYNKGLVFNYFPKGTLIPPSGPSKRHNAVLDSTPHNWVELQDHVPFLHDINFLHSFLISFPFLQFLG